MTKEVIEYFESQKKELEYFREMYPSPEDEGYKDTTKEIGFVDMAISALKGGWIPIEEREPKCCGVYYVTRLLGDGFEEQYITDASFFDGSNKWHDDNRINHGRDYLDDVVAWFEVEPYKKGE